jgi:hypothetical protein
MMEVWPEGNSDKRDKGDVRKNGNSPTAWGSRIASPGLIIACRFVYGVEVVTLPFASMLMVGIAGGVMAGATMGVTPFVPGTTGGVIPFPPPLLVLLPEPTPPDALFVLFVLLPEPIPLDAKELLVEMLLVKEVLVEMLLVKEVLVKELLVLMVAVPDIGIFVVAMIVLVKLAVPGVKGAVPATLLLTPGVT